MNYPYDNVFYEGVDDYREKKSEEKEVIRVLRTLACLKIDVQRLCVIIQHERWLTKELRMRGILFADDWQQFVKNDIHNFYTEIRSILDHVAMVLALRNRDAMPVSFEKLRERLQITEIRSMLENDLITLIEGCDWFSEIRDIRNQIIHHGFDSKVALEEDTNSTYFKLERPLSPRTIRLPMRFERIDGYVNFEHYSGYYCGLLLTFLNGIAKSLQARYSWDFGALYWSPESFLPMAENILHASEALESKAIQE